MPYFPFFADITGQPCLIVGGGRIALHKIRKLLPFSPEIHVVAEDISPEISSLPELHITRRRFEDSDLDGMRFVIAATDDHGVNSHVARLCERRRIPCNAVDDRRTARSFSRRWRSAAISPWGYPPPEKVRCSPRNYAAGRSSCSPRRWRKYAL